MSDIDTEARSMGWRPKEEFRGDPDKWVDAETFVDRGRHFVPILRANQRKLEEQNSALREELQGVKSLLSASQDAISALKEFQTEETKRQVTAIKKQLTERLREARDDGNIENETAILDELTDLRAAEKAAAKAPAPAPAPAPAAADTEVDPAFLSWVGRPENSWFGKDKRKTSLAVGIAQELRADPANNTLVGEAFFNKVAEEVDSFLGNKTAPTSKVEGSRGGTGGTSGAGAGKGFSALPADAKAACSDMERRMVGEGRAFKDRASWQAHYAKVYFASEE
jgi:gas vesicle protein